MQDTSTATLDATIPPSLEPTRIDKLGSQVHKSIDKASAATGPLVDKLASTAHQATDHVTRTANQAGSAIESAADRIKREQARMVDCCSTYVREKPMQSLGMALGAGFLLGLLARR